MRIRSGAQWAAIVGGLVSVAVPAIADQGIETVVVTAEKRAQDVQTVPVTMNVISQKQFNTYNMASLKDLSAEVPGFTDDRSSYDNYYLRGFGTAAGPNPSLSQSVAFYVDGSFEGRARELMAPLFDISRIEVLRGPQGALLGKDSAAGAISVITNDPTDQFDAGVKVDYLFDGQKGVDVDGYVSGPITDTLNGRIALKIVSNTGWLSNSATGTHDPRTHSESGRLTLVWTPTDQITDVVKYEYNDYLSKGSFVVGVPVGVTRPELSGFVSNNPGVIGGPNAVNINKPQRFNNTLTFDMGCLTLVSVTSLSDFSSRATVLGANYPPETVATDYSDTFGRVAQEVRLLSPTGQKIEWIAGLYFDADHYDVRNAFNYYNFFGFTGQLSSIFHSSSETYSAYATATWHVTDEFSLIAGVRGTDVSRRGNYALALTSGVLFPGTAPVAIPTDHEDESFFDPSITAQYFVTDSVMLYANYGKGSKGGAFQAANRAATAATFNLKPEISTNYEVGAKTRFWDFLTLNVAAYFEKLRNQQVSQFIVPPGSPPNTPATLISTNAARAESKGVELTLDADLGDWVDGLSVSFAGAYDYARYTDYPGAACTYAATLAGCASGYLDPPANKIPFNGKGTVLNDLPDWSGTLTARYTHLLTDALKFGGTVSADMKSHMWTDYGVYNPAIGYQPGNTKVNFRVTLGAPDDAWTVSLVGTNIFNVFTTEGVYNFITVNDFSVDQGRVLTVEGTLKF